MNARKTFCPARMSDIAPKRRVLTRAWPSLPDELALEILQYMGAPELVRLRVAGA